MSIESRGFNPEAYRFPTPETRQIRPELEQELEDEKPFKAPRSFWRKITMTLALVTGLSGGGGYLAWEKMSAEAGMKKEGIEGKEKSDTDEFKEYTGELKKLADEIKSESKNLSSADRAVFNYERFSLFLANNPQETQKLNEMIDLSLSSKDLEVSPSKLYNTLAEIGSQDVFYERLRATHKYQELIAPKGSLQESFMSPSLRENHFDTLSKGFLPTGAEISREEIDPRYFVAENTKEIANNIQHNPSWSSAEKTAEFKKVLDDKATRAVLESDDFDLNLAQAYSLIKIAIENKRAGDGREYSAIIQDLSEKQEDALGVDVLSKNTDNFIFVTGKDKDSSRDMSQFASSYEEMGKKLGVKNIVGLKGDGGSKEQFKNAVIESKGATTIYLDAHSNEKYFVFNEKELMDASEFAKTLLSRAVAGEKLSSMTIILGGCESAGLADNIINELEREVALRNKKEKNKKKKINLSELDLPNFVTAVSGSREKLEMNVLRDDFFELANSGSINLGDIIKTLQPKVYGNGADLSISVGGKGKSEKISALEKESAEFTV